MWLSKRKSGRGTGGRAGAEGGRGGGDEAAGGEYQGSQPEGQGFTPGGAVWSVWEQDQEPPVAEPRNGLAHAGTIIHSEPSAKNPLAGAPNQYSCQWTPQP